jgi:hypothetical protein
MHPEAPIEALRYLAITSQDDIRKLHSEMQQARNQQFTLGTVALTAFGLSSWMLPRSEHGVGQSALYAYATIALISIFWLMLRWSKTLWTLIVIISKYLELRDLSEWEKDFRGFSATSKELLYRSQSRAVASMYLLLGILVGIGYCINLFQSGQQGISVMSLFVFAVLLAYITYSVRSLAGMRLDAVIEEQWRRVLVNRLQRNEPEVGSV